MNQLNETLRVIRTQIEAEEKKDEPDKETIEQLRKEEMKCLKTIMKN